MSGITRIVTVTQFHPGSRSLTYTINRVGYEGELGGVVGLHALENVATNIEVLKASPDFPVTTALAMIFNEHYHGAGQDLEGKSCNICKTSIDAVPTFALNPAEV